MREAKENYIKCPACGAQYLAAEIYLPDYFLGRPYYIDKDHMSGKVRDFFGTDMDTVETYKCDYCNTPFKVNAKIQFVTTTLDKYDMNSPHRTKLKEDTLTLPED